MAKLQLVLLSLLGLVAAGPFAVPYADNKCQHPIKDYSYTTRNGTKVQGQPFSLGKGASLGRDGTSNFETYQDIQIIVPNAKTDDPRIFWKFEQLDDHSRVLFTRPYKDQYDVPGRLVLNAGRHGGCYLTNPGIIIQMSYCRGYEDCLPFSLGDPALYATDPAPVPKKNLFNTLMNEIFGKKHVSANATKTNVAPQGGVSKAQDGPGNKNNQTVHRVTGPLASLANALRGKLPVPAADNKATRDVRRSGSISSRALNAFEARKGGSLKLGLFQMETCNQTCKAAEFWAKCKVTPVGNPVGMLGAQVMVSQWFPCSSGTDCSLSVEQTQSYSTEVSVGQSETNGETDTSSHSESHEQINSVQTTNTDGTTIEAHAGIEFGPFSAGGGVSHEHSTVQENGQTNDDTSIDASSRELSKSITKQMGLSTTTSKSRSHTSETKIMSGTNGVLTYAAEYRCQPVKIDCGVPFHQIGTTTTLEYPNGKDKAPVAVVRPSNTTVPYLNSRVCTPFVVNGELQGAFDVLYAEQF